MQERVSHYLTEFFGITGQTRVILRLSQLRHVYKYFLVLLCVFVFLLVFVYAFVYQKNRTITTKPTVIKILQNGHISPVVLKPINGLPQHTDLIGTTEQPTMDGGIINAADGLPVVAASEIAGNKAIATSHVIKQGEYYMQKSHTKTQGKNAPSFQDDWATSSRVKKFLRNAAKDGKLAYVLDKTEEKGLPASVAVVPMVESNYQANVTSNKGAGGIWQLMPAAARDYGIKNDDRYKFELATKAALTLLQDLHKQFGSWELAFAAYNAGADRVGSALQKNPHAHSVEDLDLPKETKDYVKHIMALNKTMGSL